MRQPYSGIAAVTLCRNRCNLVLLVCFKLGEVFLSTIKQFYVNPVLILGQGYTCLRYCSHSAIEMYHCGSPKLTGASAD